MTSGIILLDKPSGVTSFKALGELKKKLGHKKIGHTGTLDKFASGLVVVLAGSFTRLNPYFTNLDKKYEAVVTFGRETSTLDPEGDTVKTGQVPDYNIILEVLESFKGKQLQVPPDFSAVHINGKRAYKRKLDGEEFDIPPREINIKNLEVLSWKNPDLVIGVECSKGTYIRSLARDIGKASGSCCFLSALKRTGIGSNNLTDAVSPVDFDPEKHLFRGKGVFEGISEVRVLNVRENAVSKILNGVPFREDFIEEKEKFDGTVNAMFCKDDFLGIVERKDAGFKYGFIVGNGN